jgi:hypothetical protein
MNKSIIKAIAICLAIYGTLMIGLNHTIPGLVVLSIASLGGMLVTSKHIVGN